MGNNLAIDTDQVKRFLSTLWPGQEDGFLSICYKKKDSPTDVAPSSKFFTFPLKLDLVCSASARMPDCHVWHSIGCMSRRPEKGRGTEKDVMAIPGVAGDIDCLGGVHNQKNLPTKDQALELIASFPFKPSLLIWSGGGYQPYWLFRESWIFSGEDDRKKAKELSSRWHSYIMARAKEHGWKLDNCGSIEHLFRVPGTFNHKAEPIMVQIVEASL